MKIIDKLCIPKDFKIAISKLIEMLSLSSDINEIILFGSTARGEVSSYSDIDICILSDKSEYDLLTDSVITNAFLELVDIGINIQIDVLVYRDMKDLENQAYNSRYSVSNGIIKDGITIYRRCY